MRSSQYILAPLSQHDLSLAPWHCIICCSDGDGVSQNGAKVLEYCEKALSIAMTMTDKRAVYLGT